MDGSNKQLEWLRIILDKILQLFPFKVLVPVVDKIINTEWRMRRKVV